MKGIPYIFGLLLLFVIRISIGQTLPEKNRSVIEFVEANMGRTVDRGECWDLAAGALNHAGCELTHIYDFGDTIKYPDEPLLPGDILQIENVKLKFKRGDTLFTGAMTHHTAIVYKVADDYRVVLAEQNGSKGRIVALTDLDFSNIVSGRIYYFRPNCD